MFRRWRRLDYPGLEILNLSEDAQGYVGRSVIVDSGEEPFGMLCEWRLDLNWRSRSLDLTRIDASGESRLHIARAGSNAWCINGEPRADLDGCVEVDVSATPFCNGLALRHLGNAPGEFMTLYVRASELSAAPSWQRYERLGARKWRYVDLGVAKGFTAVLEFDSDGFVRPYKDLFEALD
jgi:uncharacterized protein